MINKIFSNVIMNNITKNHIEETKLDSFINKLNIKQLKQLKERINKRLAIITGAEDDLNELREKFGLLNLKKEAWVKP